MFCSRQAKKAQIFAKCLFRAMLCIYDICFHAAKTLAIARFQTLIAPFNQFPFLVKKNAANLSAAAQKSSSEKYFYPRNLKFVAELDGKYVGAPFKITLQLRSIRGVVHFRIVEEVYVCVGYVDIEVSVLVS